MPKISSELGRLIREATGGNRGAIESLLMHYHDPLLAELRHFVRRSTTSLSAEDVLQDTFVEVFRRIRSFDDRGPEAFLAWLKTVARSRLLNAIRRERAVKRGGGRQKVSNSPLNHTTATTLLNRLAGPEPTASHVARRKEAIHAVIEAVCALDPLRQKVVHQRYILDLSIEEIATGLGKSPGAVKMLLNRAIKDLRRAIVVDGAPISLGA